MPGMQFGALMIPARVVGGDLYDFFPVRGDRQGIVVGDVSDKGMPAALFMSLTYSLIRAEAARSASAARALQAVNGHLMRMNVSLMFVTVLYAQLDCKSGKLHYARAGHPPPLILDPHGQVVELPVTGGQFLGVLKRPRLDEQQIQLAPGSLALFYSDGLTEAADADGRELGEEGAVEVLRENRDRPAQEICERLWGAVLDHSGTRQHQDDVTLVCLKISQP
jgi:sigma-B regulation protein RsbU (phosphoserine phosphatase)